MSLDSIKQSNVLCTAIGGVSGYISTGFFSTWIQPVIISAVCALVGLLVSHFGKKVLKKFKL